jgi:hypothetical protein
MRIEISFSSNVIDLEQTSERKGNMMDNTNTQEKLEDPSVNKRNREIKFVIDLDLGERTNSNQKTTSKRERYINTISKSQLTGKVGEKSAI